MKQLHLIILSICLLFLSGCSNLNTEITIDSDGSGTWKTDITSQVGAFDKRYITEPLEKNNIKDYKLSAQTPEGKMKTVNPDEPMTSAVWKVETSFKNPEELRTIRDMFGSNSEPALQKTADGNYIVDLGRIKDFPGQTTIKVTGEILPESTEKGTIKDSTITFQNQEQMYFTFKPGHSWLFYIGIILGAAVIIGGGYIFYLRRKYYGDAA